MEPTIYKPSIYKGESIYNTGAGGGGGSSEFIIDVGGGVTQEMTFPTYLVPLEYTDTSNFTGNDLTISGSLQFTTQDNDELVCKLAYDLAKNANGGYPFATGLANGESGSNATIGILVSSSKYVGINYENIQCDITGTNLHFDEGIKIVYNGSLKSLTVTDDYGNSYVKNRTSAYTSHKQGHFGVFGLPNQTPTFPFYGKFKYLYIKNSDKVKLLFVPARHKDPNIHNIYVVECVNGIVGFNSANDFNLSAITFGNDINLSDIQNYFT